jgi:hypothetical protein
MKTKLLQQEGGPRTYVVVLETGDEIMSCLGRAARSERLSAAQITAIGAFSEATLPFFDWESREYHPVRAEAVRAYLPNGTCDGTCGHPSMFKEGRWRY